MILTGDAVGVDALAAEWAIRNSVPRQIYKARWWEHVQAAGPLRNRKMARDGDALVLIWDGHSHGSRSMRNEAQWAGLPIHELIFKEDGQSGL